MIKNNHSHFTYKTSFNNNLTKEFIEQLENKFLNLQQVFYNQHDIYIIIDNVQLKANIEQMKNMTFGDLLKGAHNPLEYEILECANIFLDHDQKTNLLIINANAIELFNVIKEKIIDIENKILTYINDKNQHFVIDLTSQRPLELLMLIYNNYVKKQLYMEKSNDTIEENIMEITSILS
jgi:hypothetical protein